ncbi:phenazine biosynthesis [Emericellopsis cladophorae]|uniref:Phenazine biosynthesis n=1 Tax=Emericellopsis cladophorae TaxID=2686198 RepID=A0A9P9Y2I8_9HYPO|nr:phenazine biosynthesis [Emericellopsis cladophorae]KAI6781905.1 phenazine biosynthesis [Emericellopsis cladophorae]
MAPITATVYNAFTSPSAQGNPAAVIVLDSPDHQSAAVQDGQDFPCALFPPDAQLQSIGTQINLPMTAFVLPLPGGSCAEYAVRWFNATNEGPLCGHATLAMSGHLFNMVARPPPTFRYLTRFHGVISASQHQNPLGDGKLVGIEFPELTNLPPVPRGSETWAQLKSLFEEATSSRWQGPGEPLGVYKQDQFLLIEFSPELDLAGVQIEPQNLSSLKSYVYIFQISAQSSEQIHSRVLHSFPGHADEDIATGSAHRAIIPHALGNPETRARLEKYHPQHEGDALRVAQQSRKGGELVVQWLREDKSVRIMGRVDPVGAKTVEASEN